MAGNPDIQEIMKLLHPLSASSKLEIISRLSNELHADLIESTEIANRGIDQNNGSIEDFDETSILKSELKEAIENFKLVRQGKLIARPAKDLLNEL